MLQVGDLVVDIWELPDWVIQSIFMLLTAGFPIALYLSWKYDLSEESPPATDSEDSRQRRQETSRDRRKLVTVAALPVSVLLILVILYGWPDERLDPNLRHLLDAPTIVSNDIGNAAYLFYGFSAPAGEDPYVYGKFLVDTYETLGTFPTVSNPLRFTISTSDRGDYGRLGIPDDPFADLENLPALLEANSEKIARYRMLRETPTFTEVFRPAGHVEGISDFVQPRINDLIMAEFLVRREIMYEAKFGSTERAWEIWRMEVETHRSMLATSNQILMKLLSARSLSELIRLRVVMLSFGYSDHAGDAMQRLSVPERSAAIAIRYDIVSNLNALLDARTRSELSYRFDHSSNRLFFAVLPFRRNATANYALPELDVLRASLLEARDILDWVNDRQQPRRPWWEYLTNGAGVLYARRGEVDWTQYWFRLHELDRLIVLSHIAEELIAEQVAADLADNWLTSLPSELRDPFTGMRATYVDGMLSFPDPELGQEPARGLDLPLR